MIYEVRTFSGPQQKKSLHNAKYYPISEHAVTSTSYLLDNTYDYIPLTKSSPIIIHHFYLYRLPEGDSASFEMLGIDKIFKKCICLVEWPVRLGAGRLPERRLEVFVAQRNDEDGEEVGREVTLTAIDGDNKNGNECDKTFWSDRVREWDETYFRA